MKKIASALTITLLIAVTAIPTTVAAADCTVKITGVNVVKANQTITMTVTYQATSIGVVHGQLRYDQKKLQYLSGGTSRGDTGLVQLKAYSTDARSDKIIFKLKFQTLQGGTTALKVSTIETQNINEDQSLGAPQTSKTLTITAAPSSETTTAPTTEQETTSQVSDQYSDTTETIAAEESESTEGTHPFLWLIIGIALAICIGVILWQLIRKK